MNDCNIGQNKSRIDKEKETDQIKTRWKIKKKKNKAKNLLLRVQKMVSCKSCALVKSICLYKGGIGVEKGKLCLVSKG